MNVAIVGNSNCVFRNGFAKGVERFVADFGGEVSNYSLGGSCCALHIYTLHSRYEQLCSADLVFLDSLIIDTAHWRRGIVRQDELLSLIDDMYALYSKLPSKVVSLLFPGEKHVGKQHALATYDAHLRAANKYGVDVVDMYQLLPDGAGDYSEYFIQPGHIKTEIACEIGYRVSSICAGMLDVKQCEDELLSPYRVVSGEVFADLEAVALESSLFRVDCYKLDREVRLGMVSGMNLIGALHWNKASSSKLVVSSGKSDDVVQLRSRFAFFEVLNAKRKITSASAVRPGRCDEEVTQRPAGNGNELDLGMPQLAGLLLRGDEAVKATMVGLNRDLSSHIGNVFKEALA